jgi:glycosyltransferase involved in cell wall biosynthesis
LAVIGRFDSENWFLSHIGPLARVATQGVVVVTEKPLAVTVDKVRFFCAPQRAQKLLGRMLTKFIWLWRAGRQYKPDIFIGYHIFPGALTALIVARIFGRPACYQMTGGPVEVLGGGVDTENPLMRRLGRPSSLIERLALAVVRQFDVVVVRGEKARTFLRERNVQGHVAVITGSIDCPPPQEGSERPYDLIFVGRVAEIKQPLSFVDIVGQVKIEVPSVRAAVVGDGPLLEAMQERARELQLEKNIEFLGKQFDVDRFVRGSKTFILTSRSEGLSIAMAEAMAVGAVPVVADVGELGDLVKSRVNGYLAPADQLSAYSSSIVRLLQDQELWMRLSRAAIQDAARHSGIEFVAKKWAETLLLVCARVGREQLGVTAEAEPAADFAARK